MASSTSADARAHKALGSTDICVRCGGPYIRTGCRQKYCPDCAHAVRPSGKTAKAERICVQCGRPYTWTAPRQKYCQDCAQTRSPRRKVGGVGACARCGKEYIITGPTKMLCPDCAPKYQARRLVLAEDGKKSTGVETRRRLGSVDVCEECGEEYVVIGGRQKYCPKCSVSVRARRSQLWQKNERKYRAAIKDTLNEPARTLSELIGRYGVSQHAFAKYFGISNSLISSWCTGTCKCPEYVLNMAAKILSFSAQELQDVEAEDHD